MVHYLEFEMCYFILVILAIFINQDSLFFRCRKANFPLVWRKETYFNLQVVLPIAWARIWKCRLESLKYFETNFVGSIILKEWIAKLVKLRLWRLTEDSFIILSPRKNIMTNQPTKLFEKLSSKWRSTWSKMASMRFPCLRLVVDWIHSAGIVWKRWLKKFLRILVSWSTSFIWKSRSCSKIYCINYHFENDL